MTKDAYSIAELSKLTGLGRTLVFAEIKSGRLIARKAGRRTIILRSDLESWLASLPAARPAICATEEAAVVANGRGA